jgi:hypothetical protein
VCTNLEKCALNNFNSFRIFDDAQPQGSHSGNPTTDWLLVAKVINITITHGPWPKPPSSPKLIAQKKKPYQMDLVKLKIQTENPGIECLARMLLVFCS